MAIVFDVGFRVKGQELTSALAGPIHQISTEIDGAFQNAIAKSGKMAPEVQKAVVAANALKTALNEATTNKGLSLSLMEQSLARSGLSVRQMLTNLSAGGPTFAKSFNLALASLATANRQVITLSSTLQEAGRVFTQSLKFTSAQTAIRFLTSSFQQAVGWVKDLDSAVANIAVVTGKAGEGLQSVYDNIIEGAADLRVASKEYAEASLIFYQQGLNDSEVQRRTQITIESAKAAGQSVETMASQLTAIWNSYQMIGEEQQRAAAVGAKLAASTAVDFKTIAEAMQTAAAPAAQMGVSYNSLAAIIATVGDTTQQSASVIGNAYKTIFSRFQQLTTEGTDGEVTLNSVSKKLQALGINVLDSADKLRDLDSVILDVGMSWDTYSEEQQLAIAEIVGGTRQYGQFLSLMNNFPKYLQLVKTASEETGDTLVQQFIAARDTIQSAAEMSKEAWNKAMGQLFNGDSLKDFYKGLEQIGNAFGVIIKSAGGLPGILSMIALILQKQISDRLISTGIGFKNIVNNITPKRQAASIDRETERNISNSRATWQFQMDKGKMTQNDVAANEVKLRQAGELSKRMIAVNKLINEGDSAAKSLGEAMKVAMENANKKFNEGIDKVTQLKNAIDKVKEEVEEQIKVSITAEGDPDKLRQAVIAAQMGEDDALVYQDAKTTLEGTAASPGLNTQVQDLENQIKKSEELKKINTQIADLENQRAQARRSHEAGSAKAVKDLNKQLQALKDQKKAYKDVSVLSEEEGKNIEKKLSGLKEEQRRLQELVNSYEAITQEVLDQEKASLKLSAAFARAGSELSSSVVSGAQSGKTALEGLIQEISNKDLPLDDAIRNSIIAGLQDGGIDVSAQEAANRIKSVIEQNLEGLDFDLGVNAQDFEEISEAAQDTTESIGDLTDTEKRAGDAADDMKMSASQLAEASVQTVTGITMLAMQMNNLTESFVTGNLSAGQFVTQLLLMAPAALSMASGLRTLVGGLITTFGTVEAGKWTILGFKMALDSATLGITAIISAIVVVTAGVAGFIRGEAKRLQETQTENAQKALEMAEATNTATAAIAEAIPVYYEATEGIEKLSRSTQEYADAANTAAEAAQNIINALRNSGNEDMEALANDLEKGLNVAQYTGDWEDLNKLMDETQKKALEISVNTNKEAQNAAAEILTTNVKKETKIGSGMSDTDEIGAAAVITQNQKLQDYEHIDFNGLGSNLEIKNDGSIEDIIASYEEALDLYDKMASKLSADEQAKSEYFKGLKNYINEAADAYAQYNTAVEGSFEQQSQLFNLDPEAFFKAMKIDPEELGIENINDLLIPEDGFTSIKEYDEWAKKIHKIGDEAGWTKTQIEQMQTSDKGTVAVQMAKDKISSATQHGRDAAKIANDNRSNLDKNLGANKIDTENLQQAKEDALKILQNAEKELEQHSDFPFSWGSKEKKEEAVRAAQEVYDQIAQAANQEEYLTDIFENMGPEMQKYFNDLEIDPQLNEEELKASVEKQLKRFGSLELQANAEVHLQDTSYAERQEIVDNLKLGDTISPEEFDKLGKGYEGFFKLMEDGTYQLIEDSELLANQVESLQQKILLDDSVQVAADAQQYKTEDPELYASMMETAIGSQQQLLASADSLRELNDLYATLQANMQEAGVNGVSYTAFSQALIGLASQFENTAQECEAYQLALRNGDEEQIKIAESALRAATVIGECAEKYDLNAKSLEIQARELKESNKEMDLTDEQAAMMAVTNQRLNKGIATLTKNWKSWSKELKKSDKTTQDYSDTAAELSDVVADIVGWYDELSLSSEFITENFDLIEGAAKGNTTAILKLGAAVAQESVANAKLDSSLVNVINGADETNRIMFGVNTAFEEYWQSLAKGTTAEEAFASAQAGVASGFSAIQQNMDALLSNDKSLSDILGGPEGLNAFVEDLNAYASATGMTAQEMQQMLSSVGVTANVETDYIEQKMEVPTYVESSTVDGYKDISYTDFEGNEKTQKIPRVRHFTIPDKPLETTGYIGVARIDMKGADGSSSGVPPLQFTGKQPPSTSAVSGGKGGGGGGGGSKKSNFKKKDAHKKSDPLEERYANIKSSIDKTSRSIEKLSDAMDDAWGAKKYKNLLAINQQLGVQAEKNQILLKEARQYLALDQSNLQKVLSDNGLGQALFNSDGFLSNKENIYAALNQLREPLEQAVQAAIDAYNAAGEGAAEEVLEGLEKQQEIAEKALSDFEENIQSKVLEQIDKVNDSAEEAHEAMKELINSIREIMSNWVEAETLKLDLRMEINDQDIRTAEHLLEVWGDIGTKMGMTADKYKEIAGSNIDTIEGALKNAQTMQDMIEGLKRGDNDAANWLKDTHGEEAYNKWLNGNGGVPDVVMEQLAAAVDQMQDARDAGQEALRNMMQEWTKALGMMMEDFDKLAEKLEHNQETLDMWSNVLDGMGMSQTVDGATAMAKAAKASYDTTLKQSHVLKEQALTAKTASTAANKALNDFKDAHGGAMFDFANLTENEQIQYQEFLSWVEESDAALAEAESAFKSKISELVDKMGEVLEKELTRLRAEFFSKIDGAFYDWDSMENIYGMMEDQEDLFLSDLDKHYNLDKLTGEINDYIEDSVDLSNMEDYEALLEEINGLLESGQKINQTDLDSLIAKFNIMKEMDAYEEAKNSKNTMRLQRDASGNYAYVYSSDASASDAEDQTQKLKDALYEYEKLQQDAADAMEDAWLATFAKIGKLEEDRAKAEAENNEKTLADIDEQLRIENENLDYYASEIEKRYGNIEEFLKKYRDNDKTNFDWLQNHKEVSFNQSNLNYLMGTEDTFDKMTGFHEHFKEYMVTDFQVKIDEVRTELVNKTLVDIETVGEGLDFMEGDYTDLADLVEDKSNDIMASNKEVADSATNLRNTSTAAIDVMTKNIVSNSNIMVRELNRVVQEINKAIQALQAYRRAQQEEMENTPNNTFTSDTNEEGNDKPVNPSTPSGPIETPPQGGGNSGYKTLDDYTTKAIAATIIRGATKSQWYNGNDRWSRLDEVYGPGAGRQVQNQINAWHAGGKKYNVPGEWVAVAKTWEYTYPNMKSAYTGGLFTEPDVTRIAEKGPEIVLNAKDTENILAAVALMRQTVAAQFGSINGSLLGATSGISSAAQAFSTSSQVVDQNVKIEASFPGVSVAQEIEDALNSLITQAAQYNIKK